MDEERRKLAFTRYATLLKRDVGYAVSVECTFCRLSSKRRKREHDDKSNEMKGKENRKNIARWSRALERAREAFQRVVFCVNDDAIGAGRDT